MAASALALVLLPLLLALHSLTPCHATRTGIASTSAVRAEVMSAASTSPASTSSTGSGGAALSHAHLSPGRRVLGEEAPAASALGVRRALGGTPSEEGDPVTTAREDWAPDASVPAVQVLWFLGTPEVVSHIGQGETVQWIWWDDLQHSVEGVGEAAAELFQGKGGGKKPVSGQGYTYNITFDSPGEFSYRCHFHPEIMKGRVVVKPRVNFGGVTLPWYDGVSYGGASAVVEEGDVVSWQWFDDLPHSLQTLDGNTEVFSGPGTNGDAVARNGFVYKTKFPKAGTFLYLCAQHGESMRGNITVVPKAAFSDSTSPPS